MSIVNNPKKRAQSAGFVDCQVVLLPKAIIISASRLGPDFTAEIQIKHVQFASARDQRLASVEGCGWVVDGRGADAIALPDMRPAHCVALIGKATGMAVLPLHGLGENCSYIAPSVRSKCRRTR
jgi:hypothetical protein